jgi:hypothetical protein
MLAIGLGLSLTPRVSSAAARLAASAATIAQWYGPSGLTRYQSRTGTADPVTASAQNVGQLIAYKGGATYNLVAPSDSRRPLSTAGLTFDGTDDGLVATVAGANNRTLIALVKTSDTTAIIWSDGITNFVTAMDATGGAVASGAGTPTHTVDGGANLTTRVNLRTAAADGAVHRVECAGANLSTWTTLGISSYNGSSFPLTGVIIPIAMLDSAHADYAAALTLARAVAAQAVTDLAL